MNDPRLDIVADLKEILERMDYTIKCNEACIVDMQGKIDSVKKDHERVTKALAYLMKEP